MRAVPAATTRFDGADDAVVQIAMAQMIEHQRAGPDRADRVGDPFAGDVGRRAVDRLEHRRKRPLRVDVGARRDAEASRNRRADVGEDVAEEIRRDDHVERLRVRDHPRGERVDVILRGSRPPVVLPHDLRDLVPEHHRVRSALDLVALASILRGRFARARSRSAGSARCRAREDAGLLRHLVRRADVDASADAGVLALGVLAHADHVDVARAAVGERRGEPGEQPHRPQVDVLIEPLADGEDQRRRDVIGDAGAPIAPR